MEVTRRSLCAAIAGLPVLARRSETAPADSSAKIYWGDLHCHSNLSYGEGNPETGIQAAREHLDFATITGHAAWPDMPNEPGRLSWVIDYHNKGFEKVRKGWSGLLEMMKKYREDGRFIPFPSYEWHSMKWGDHHVVHRDLDGELILADTLESLKEKLEGRSVIVIPHHIAYQTGYRGINWDYYTPNLSPVVEILSKHGISETDYASKPMLHDMGPRVAGGTAAEGLRRGYHFGFIGSTDNHSGFPGSYGEGRVAVFANSLTAGDLWDAINNRRTYAATGDRIELRFGVNGQMMGRSLPNAAGKEISLSIRGEDFVDYVEVLRNGVPIRRFNGAFPGSAPRRKVMRVKFRIEWGWGDKVNRLEWNGNCRITDGKVLNVTPYFRGQLLLAPRADHEKDQQQFTPVHTIRNRTEKGFDFHSYSYGNPNTLTPATSSVVVEAEMAVTGRINVTANGRRLSYTLSDLLDGTQAEFLRGWLTEAVQLHRAVPSESLGVKETFTDTFAEPAYYYARVRQYNGQWAWSSPVRFT